MAKRVLRAACALGLFSLGAGPALADNCTALANTNWCGTFTYSTGGSNSYNASFGSGGAFNLGGNSPGTYTCYGRSFTEVDYAFGGIENHVWYTRAGRASTKGFGKSTTSNYLYNFTLVPGTCPAAAHPQSTRQDR